MKHLLSFDPKYRVLLNIVILNGFLVLALGACSVAPKSASQGAYEGTAAFATALKGANAYAAMPRCSVTVKPPCSDQARVNQIAAAANKADAAVTGAQNVAKDTTVPGTDVQKAIAAANDAVAALVKIIPAT